MPFSLKSATLGLVLLVSMHGQTSVKVLGSARMSWSRTLTAGVPLTMSIPVDFSSSGEQMMEIDTELDADVAIQMPDGNVLTPNASSFGVYWAKESRRSTLDFSGGTRSSGTMQVTLNSPGTNRVTILFLGSTDRFLMASQYPLIGRAGSSVSLVASTFSFQTPVIPATLTSTVVCSQSLSRAELTPILSLVSTVTHSDYREETYQLSYTNKTSQAFVLVDGLALQDWPSHYEAEWDSALAVGPLAPASTMPVAKLRLRLRQNESFDPSSITWRITGERNLGTFSFSDSGLGPDMVANDKIFTSQPITFSGPGNCRAEVESLATDSSGVQFARATSTSFEQLGNFASISSAEEFSADRNQDGKIDEIGTRVRLNVLAAGHYIVTFSYKKQGQTPEAEDRLEFIKAMTLSTGEHVVEVVRNIYDVKRELGSGQYIRGDIRLDFDHAELGLNKADVLPGPVLTPTFSSSMFPANRLTGASLSNLQAVASGASGTLFDKVQVNLNFQLSAPAESCGYSLQLSSPTSGTTSPEVNANFSVESNTHSAANQTTTLVFNFGPILPAPDRNRPHHYTLSGLPANMRVLNATGQSLSKP
jgi:hypothetical protein